MQLGELEEGSKAKPPRASLFKSMDPETVDLETALEAPLPAAGRRRRTPKATEITAQNGRYGPYLKKGTDSRSLESEDQIFNVTLAEAEAIFAQPKQRRGQSRSRRSRSSGPAPTPASRSGCSTAASAPTSPTATTNATVPRGLDPADAHARGGDRPAAGAGGEGPGEEEGGQAHEATKKAAKKKTTKKTTTKKTTRRRRPRSRRPRRRATKAAAKPASDTEPATP